MPRSGRSCTACPASTRSARRSGRRRWRPARSSARPSCGRWRLAVRMVDLTTLEGADTPGKVRGLCAKARHPDPDDPSVPPVAAVCVYPDLVAPGARRAGGQRGGGRLGGDRAFPSGRASLAVKLADVADAVDAGADEVDMVIDRGAFLVRPVRAGLRGGARGARGLRRRASQGDPGDRRAGHAGQHRRAAWLAMLAGADFIKTSTGKVHARRHAAGGAGDAVRRAGLRARRRAAGSASRSAAASGPPRTPSATWCWSARSPGRAG